MTVRTGGRIASALGIAVCLLVLTTHPTSADEPEPVTPAQVGISPEVQSLAERNVGMVKLSGKRGTGWIAGEGLVVTDNHVSRLGTNQSVFVADADGSEHDCYTVVANEGLDIAVLRCSGLAGPGLELRPDLPPVGTAVFTSGHPGAGPLASAGGHITALDTVAMGSSRLEYDVYAIPGSSGSPVLDGEGRVVSSIIGGIGRRGRTFGSKSSEIAPLIAHARSAPSTIELAMLLLTLKRAAIPALIALVVAGYLIHRTGRRRWLRLTVGVVAAVIAAVGVFTLIDVSSTGLPLYVG